MAILLRKSYLVKVTTKGGGGVKNTQKIDHVVYGWPLTNSLDALVCFQFCIKTNVMNSLYN